MFLSETKTKITDNVALLEDDRHVHQSESRVSKITYTRKTPDDSEAKEV